MGRIEAFIHRLKKLGIKVELSGNYPWVYLDKVNGRRVVEHYQSDYGFTIAFMPIRPGQPITFPDISLLFKTIRKYV
jgi:hypothetical protein